MVSAKVRIRFRKAGDLRLISHHDLMRCWERMLRRAALPFHSTSGFNPKPRLVFPLSLALGIDGRREVAELELDQPVPPEEVRDRLRQQAPPGLDILEVRSIAPNAGGQVRRVTYRLEIPSDRATDLAARAAELLATDHCWIERTRPQPRRYDLRPYLHGLRANDTSLEMDLWVTPTGSARPDEVLGLLGLGDLSAAGAVLERTTVELHDEEVPLSGDPLLSGVADPDAGLGGTETGSAGPPPPSETDPGDRFAPQKGNA
jgi:radical SAM-linked protein